MKKFSNISLLFISFLLLITGITFYTKALYTANLEGVSSIHSAQWRVEARNYQKFGTNITFSKIKPGDSGVINLGARLYTDLEEVPTTVNFNYNIPDGLSSLDFYLVDNTSNQALKIAKLTGSGTVELDIELFTRTNDLELRWIFPIHANGQVCGQLSYSLTFSQGQTLTTYYTDVWVGNLGTFDNVEVTVNKQLQTVSFVLVDEEDNVILTITDVNYTDEGTSLFLTQTPEYQEGIRITNPEVIITE